MHVHRQAVMPVPSLFFFLSLSSAAPLIRLSSFIRLSSVTLSRENPYTLKGFSWYADCPVKITVSRLASPLRLCSCLCLRPQLTLTAWQPGNVSRWAVRNRRQGHASVRSVVPRRARSRRLRRTVNLDCKLCPQADLWCALCRPGRWIHRGAVLPGNRLA